MQKFRIWMAKATTAEKRAMAIAAGTSRTHLYAIAHETRNASAELGAAIAKASIALHISSGKVLPILLRSDVCPACAACPYSPKCKN